MSAMVLPRAFAQAMQGNSFLVRECVQVMMSCCLFGFSACVEFELWPLPRF